MHKQSHPIECSEEKKKLISASRKKTSLKRKQQIGKVYELKISKNHLSKNQKNQLEMLFVEAKRFYNYLLNLRQKGLDIFKLNIKDISKIQILDKDKNKLDYELKYISAAQKQAILARLGANFKICLSLLKSGKQKTFDFKFKSEYSSIPLKQFGATHKFFTPYKMKIQGIKGKVRIRGSKQIPFELHPDFANANLLKKPDGYYIHLTAFIDKAKIKPIKSNNKEVGIDFGCTNTLTFSDGRKVDVQIEESERLKKLSQRLNRHQQTRSNNRKKTIQKIRKEYQKIFNKKKDKANKICSELKKYKLVVIQDEQLSNWHKNLHSKKVQHSCMGTIKAKLLQQPNVVVLDRFIPTSKFCSKCGKKHDELKLWDRTFKCECGISQDRDIHAAQNMLDIFYICNKYFNENHLLPSDQGKVKLAEFKTAVAGTKFPIISHRTSKQENAMVKITIA